MNDNKYTCRVCLRAGGPEAPLVHLAWKHEPPNPPTAYVPRTDIIVVPKEEIAADFFICAHCIRQIKRLPFRPINIAECPF